GVDIRSVGGRGGGSNRHLYVIRRHSGPSCVCVVKQCCCIISCIDIGTCTYVCVLCCNGCPRFSFVRIFLTRGSNTTSRGVVLSVASSSRPFFNMWLVLIIRRPCYCFLFPNTCTTN
ncbi:unnamed protein product, partial [Ectocarpus sp. 8 AP-2014]